MINQKMILAVLAGFITMFVLAGLFHLVIMKEYFESKIHGTPEMMYPILSCLIVAILMSYMYPMFNLSGSTIKRGLCFGIFVGLTCRVPLQVLYLGYGSVHGDWGYVITEGLWHSVEEGIGGIVIAMIYARGGSAS